MLKFNKLMLIYLLAVIPVILVVNLQYHYFINIPFWDYWDNIPQLMKSIFDHTFQFRDLFRAHNTHRLFFTRIMYILNYFIFSGNALILTLTSFIAQFIQLVVLNFCLKQDSVLKSSPYARAFLFVFFAFLLFAPQAGQIWVWDFLIQQTFTACFYTLTLYLFTQNNLSWPRFGAVIFLAILTTLTSANGLIIWPAGLLTLILARTHLKFISSYLIIGIAVIGLYIHDLNFDTAPDSITLLSRIHYFFCFLGAPFSYNNVHLSTILGASGFIFFISYHISAFKWNYRGYINDRMHFWLTLSLITMGSAVMGSLGRFDGKDLAQALGDRYIILSAPFWCAILVILFKIYPNNKFRKIITFAIISLIMLYIPTQRKMTNPIKGLQNQVMVQNFAIKENHYIVNPEYEVARLHPDRYRALEGLQFLKKYHFSLFADLNNSYESPIGKSINSLKLIIMPEPISGKFAKLNLQDINIDTCKYDFYKGLAAAGWIADIYPLTSHIYILDQNHILLGLGYLQDNKRKNEDGHEFVLWEGFVSTAVKQHQNAILTAYLRRGNKLFPISQTQSLPSHLGCSME